MEIDFEDYVEEVKFQMIEYDILTEERIKGWESNLREWVEGHKDHRNLKYKDSENIMVRIKDEEVFENVALKFYKAVKNNQTGDYWKRFQIG